MHEATFQRLREERDDLKRELLDLRATASTAYADIITAHWLADELDLHDHGGMIIRSDEFGSS